MKCPIYDTKTSKHLYAQAGNCLVDGVASAMHKSDWEDYPIYFERGEGAHLYDADENEYIDYLGGYGPTILGFTPASVMQAVVDQISRGTQYAAPFQMLNRVSQRLVDAIPCAEIVSYTMTGTEAVMLALRLARAHTGKDKIVRFEGHYHGWSDEALISNAPNSLKMMGPRRKPWKTLGSAGQRQSAVSDIIVLPWNDLDLVEQVVRRQGHEIAAIIAEPAMLNCEVVLPQPGYLEGLREITQKNEIDLIFDEVITGFRLAIGGAQEYYGVTPDLSTFAKAAAGGYPIAGVAGQKAIMASDVHPLGTFNGNPLSIAACQATLEALEQPGLYERMGHIAHRLAEGITDIGRRTGLVLYSAGLVSVWWLQFGIGEPPRDYRDTFRIDKLTYQKFYTLCMQRGLRLHPIRGRFYVSAAHTEEDVDRTLEIVEEALTIIAHERR
jgi:glutamate-1-semialdehyde 2,1-aminomutase